MIVKYWRDQIIHVQCVCCLLQVLQTETLGKGSEFQAVPGCGLKCKVSHIEGVVSTELTDLDILNRRNSTRSDLVAIDGLRSEDETDIINLGEGIYCQTKVNRIDVGMSCFKSGSL